MAAAWVAPEPQPSVWVGFTVKVPHASFGTGSSVMNSGFVHHNRSIRITVLFRDNSINPLQILRLH